MRVLAYSTELSRQRWAPPTCSAARATAARSRVLRQARLGAALGADQPRRRVGELEPGLLAGLVHGGQRGAGEAVGVALHPEERQAGRGAPDDQDQAGRVAVEHERLVAVQRPSRRPTWLAASVMPSASHRPESSVKARVAMVSPAAIPGSRYSLAPCRRRR